MSRTLSAWILATIILGLSLSATAQMRCGTELIGEDDIKLAVLEACGEPDVVTDDGLFYPDGERWVYNFGPNQFMMIVEFRGDQVAEVTTGDYGFVEDSE